MGLKIPPHILGHFAMLCFSVLVAGSFSLGALVANEVPPIALNAFRFFFGSIAIGLVAYFTTGTPRRAFRSPWRYLLLGGTFAFYFVLMFEGLKTAPPVNSGAVFTLTPMLSAAFGYVLLRQVTTRRMWLALLIGALGALWVIFRADLAALLRFQVGQGEQIFFWGCVAHAAYTPLVRRLKRDEPAMVFSFGILAAGFLVLMALGWQEIRTTPWMDLTAQTWITLVYLSLVGLSVTLVLLQFAIMRLPSAKVMAYTYIVPSWVILWEAILGHGVPAPLVLIGVLMTAGALILLLRNEV